MIVNIKDMNLIVSDSFGMWINGIWGNVAQKNQHLGFCEKKEAFFFIIKRLLDEGKIKFVKPDADVYFNAKINRTPILDINNVEAHWDIPSEEIIKFLASRWPAAASHEDDQALNAYFYQIPAIIWRDENGHWLGS